MRREAMTIGPTNARRRVGQHDPVHRKCRL
jgi:hypothetical protein